MDIIDHILRVEGSEYTNHPSDRGGPTKYGITQHTLSRVRGYPVTAADVKALAEDEARDIYIKLYVYDPGFSKVAALSARIGRELVDSGVNCGTHRASEWLQKSLNALNRRQRDYADIKVDGDIGPATLTALARYIDKRGEEGKVVMLRALEGFQAAHYLGLAQRDEKQEDFVYGWLLNRIGTI